MGPGKSRVSLIFVFSVCLSVCVPVCLLHFYSLPYKIGNNGRILDFKVSKEAYRPADKIGSFLSGKTKNMTAILDFFKCPYLSRLKSYSVEIRNLS